jgi:malate synthase
MVPRFDGARPGTEMSSMIEKAGLQVDARLVDFIETHALPGTRIEAQVFWAGLASLYGAFAARNADLLARRDTLQAQIDAWHHANPEPHDAAAYQAYLSDIGYLGAQPEPFTIDPANVDPEVALLAGPQLVVPLLNARFVLNAANARWGSLYDALYGSDAIPGEAAGGGYDPVRGAQVIFWVRSFLDKAIPLANGDWEQARGLSIGADGLLHVKQTSGGSATPVDLDAIVGYRGEPAHPSAVLLRHHGLHIELTVDRKHPIGRDDTSHISDVVLEAALSTIVDLEDSIAAVDAQDKVAAYANWLGLMKGDLTAEVAKGGGSFTRALEGDRAYTKLSGAPLILPGRSLLFIRNVGHLMTTPAVRLADGAEAPEGILDALVTSLIALHDLARTGSLRNSRAGSIYIVKPKMHGPEEATFANDLMDAVEDVLGLARHTVKIGLMDEERRTSANLAACVAALKHRIVFINTGFLDRTGDEIHTSMRAGPMIPKAEMKAQPWIGAYEDRNVQIALAAGFRGQAQIGKGMWAAPDRMADMLEQKIGHPKAGANTAWVPSPTAAVLHATHYHLVDVAARQTERAGEPVTGLEPLLTLPLATGRNWTAAEVAAELDNNAQGLLGYVVRWIDQGVGCSKVPDIHDFGLMEDRATLRISSQHMANWLMHGVCTAEQIDAALLRMAAKVDAQNAGDPLYKPMSPAPGDSLAFQAARALVFDGAAQPSGYTEPLLHHYRALAKAAG